MSKQPLTVRDLAWWVGWCLLSALVGILAMLYGVWWVAVPCLPAAGISGWLGVETAQGIRERRRQSREWALGIARGATARRAIAKLEHELSGDPFPEDWWKGPDGLGWHYVDACPVCRAAEPGPAVQLAAVGISTADFSAGMKRLSEAMRSGKPVVLPEGMTVTKVAGGYTGGRPAATVGPPTQMPSGIPERPTDVCQCGDYRRQHGSSGCLACVRNSDYLRTKINPSLDIHSRCTAFRIAPETCSECEWAEVRVFDNEGVRYMRGRTCRSCNTRLTLVGR